MFLAPCLIPLHDHIHEFRVQFDAPADAVHFAAGDQGAAAAEEGIEHDAIGHGAAPERIAHERHRLHRGMVLAGARLVILPHGDLLAVRVPLMLPGLLPAEQARFMNPLEWRTAEHERVLFPDTATGEVEARVPECFTEIEALGVGVPNVDRTVIGQIGVHAAVRGKQEVVEIFVGHVVVHDLPGGFFHIYVIRRIGQYKICPLPIHEPGVDFFAGTVAADNAVLPEAPQVAELGEDRLCQLRLHIEIVLGHVLRVDLVEQGLDLRRIEAGEARVKIGILDILEQIGQQVFIPRAGDLVQRDVEIVKDGEKSCRVAGTPRKRMKRS